MKGFLLFSLSAVFCCSLASSQIVLEKKGDKATVPFPGGGTGPVVSHFVVQRGPFKSIQVNIDRYGRNIRGDAANEPSIAIDPRNPKNIVIGWRQFNTVSSNFRQNGYAWSHDGGKTWHFPGVIQKNVFNSDPVLDTDANGKFYYLSYPGGRTLKLFRSSNAGISWTGPTYLSGGDKAWMVVDSTNSPGKGFIYVLWQVVHGPKTFVRSTNGGASFSSPIYVPYYPTFGTMDIAPNGDLYVCGLYRQYMSYFVIGKSTNAKYSYRTPSFSVHRVYMGGRMRFGSGPNPYGLLGQAQVAVDPSSPNVVYMLCSVDPSGSDPLDVHLVKSTNYGASFGSPIRINTDPKRSYAYQWMGTFSVAPDGRIDVVWNDTRNGNYRYSETYYCYSLDKGRTWSKNIPIGPKWNSMVGWPRQNKIGDYYTMISSRAKAHLAYAATYNNEQDVYYVELGDCNHNGIHDGWDIKNGTSFDSNDNSIPDECEYCQLNLGYGGALKLSVCGDDLTKAGSKATFLVKGAPRNAMVLVAFSNKKYSPPVKLPWPGYLVPDINSPISNVLILGYTDAKGWFHTVWNGGTKMPVQVYVQAFAVKGMSVYVSNALRVTTGF